MHDLLRRETKDGLLAIKIGYRQNVPSVGFFYTTKKGNSKFITVSTKYDGSTRAFSVRKVMQNVKPTDKFFIFPYEADTIETIFSEESEVVEEIWKDQKLLTAAKELFIDLCGKYNVQGAPNYTEVIAQELDPAPEYLQISD